MAGDTCDFDKVIRNDVIQCQLAVVPVRAVRVIEKYVLAAVGQFLKVYFDGELVECFRAFQDQIIHEILIFNGTQHVLLYAETYFKILKNVLITNSKTETVTNWKSDDWILTGKIVADNILLTVSSYNNAIVWTDILTEPRAIKQSQCVDKCLSFCAKIYLESNELLSIDEIWHNMRVVTGTQFSEILIWIPCDNGVVTHRLKGHNGTIFSLDLAIEADNRKPLIASVSSDQTLRLWKCWELMRTEHAHTDRIFVTKFVSDFVLTLGEDYCMKVWHKNGAALCTIENQLSARFRCVDYCSNTIVAGSNNSAITLFNRTQSTVQKSIMQFGEKVKKLFITNCKCLIIVSDDRTLWYCDKCIDRIGDRNSVIVCDLSLCKSRFAFVTDQLVLKVYLEVSFKILEVYCCVSLSNFLVCYAIFWLSNKYVLAYGEKVDSVKVLSVFSVCKDEINEVCTLDFKFGVKGQYTNLNYLTACALVERRFLLIGDRKSNLYLYDLKMKVLLQMIRKVHSFVGITLIVCNSRGLISTAGRDGNIKRFVLENSRLIELECDKLPFSWPCAVFNTFIAGFEGVDFVVFDFNKRIVVYRENCKGAHRAYACHLVNDTFQLAYATKNAMVLNTVEEFSKRVRFLKDGFHGSDVNVMMAISLGNCCQNILLISGGDDTYLRFGLCSGAYETALFSLKCHLSTVRCLARLDDLLLSGGGRAQFLLYLLVLDCDSEGRMKNGGVSYRILCNCQIPNDNLEARVMACALVPNYYLILCCSDGSVVFYHYTRDHNRLELCNKFCFNICLTIVSVIDNIVIIGNVNGEIAVWDLLSAITMNNNSFKTYKLHKSAVLKCLAINDRFSCDKIVVTCGDDNAVVVSRLNDKLECEILIRVESRFCAQFNGMCYLSCNDLLVCSMKSQRLLVYKLRFFESKVVQLTLVDDSYVTNVCNINGICDVDGVEGLVCVYGDGFEICNILQNF